MPTTPDNIFLAIVFYRPTPEDTAAAAALGQRYRGCIADNTPGAAQPPADFGRFDYAPMGANRGIAAAHNVCLRKALSCPEVRYIVLLDQDSRTATDYPLRISALFDEYREEHPELAMLGPTVVDKADGRQYHSALHPENDLGGGLIPWRDLIASGCCIDAQAAKRVGEMDERLFIDFVDFDYCWRAHSLGLLTAKTARLTISHQVGQRTLRIHGYEVTLSRPFRYYYQYRNWLWLVRRPYVPRNWKINTSLKFALRMLWLPLFAPEGRVILPNMLKGAWAGLKRQKPAL